MKKLKKILFVFVVILCFAFSTTTITQADTCGVPPGEQEVPGNNDFPDVCLPWL